MNAGGKMVAIGILMVLPMFFCGAMDLGICVDQRYHVDSN